MAEPHSRLLTLAAREVLRPMGLIQRGRSRIWLDDQGWWIGVVEFQPSEWSRGSYLNVGVSWPWHPTDDPTLYFELSHRVGGFVEFESEAQFEPEARRLATRAAEEIGGLRVRLATVRSAAHTLRESVGDDEGWPAWHAAVACGLSGEQRSAKRLFARVAASTDDRDWWQPVTLLAETWSGLLQRDDTVFRSEVVQLCRQFRSGVGLDADHPRLDEIAGVG